MKIYVIRHGESVNNLKGLWTGWSDVELTEKGVLDAKKAGEFIKDVKLVLFSILSKYSINNVCDY